VQIAVDPGHEGGDQLVPAHPDVPVDPPHGQSDFVRSERAVPRQRVVVIRVDQRSVDVEQRGGHYACTVAPCRLSPYA
jgi:hypothetical protein